MNEVIDELNKFETDLEIKNQVINQIGKNGFPIDENKSMKNNINGLEKIKSQFEEVKNFYRRCKKLMKELKIKSLEIRKINSKMNENIDIMKEKAQKQLFENKDEEISENKREVDLNTKIIYEKKYYDLINEELKKIYMKNIKYELIYRASEDGGFGKVFKQKCSQIRGTLIVIETKSNKRFGGFTKCIWDDSDLGFKDENTFCFSFDENKIYRCNKYGYDIYCKKDSGPIFCDIFGIYNKFATEGGYTKDLEIAVTKYEDITKDFELAGEEYFEIKEMEVFKIIPI